MRRAAIPMMILALGGCGGGGSAESADLTLTIGDRQVVVNSGIVGERVDWIVIREYPVDDANAAAKDGRVRFEGGNAHVELPDGSTKSLKGSNVLFYLNDEGVEAHAIRLQKQDLDILHTEPHESVAALIEKLADISLRRGYN